MARSKTPTIGEGLTTLFDALKDDVLALIEISLKKTENGLKYLEEEVHKLKAQYSAKEASKSNHSSSTKKPTRRSTPRSTGSRKR